MIVGLFALLITPALAHRMLVFAVAEGGIIQVESKFVPDTPVRGGKVEVFEPQSGKKLLEGQTDEKGKFSFPVPAEAAAAKSDLKIVVDGGMGHRGEWLLKASQYLSGAPASKGPEVPGAAAAPPTKAEGKAGALDQQALEQALNRALEAQLAPIKEMLTELSVRRTSLPDILGGLGYIMGIFGLWAYFLAQKKKKA